MNREMKLCKCGCGQAIKIPASVKSGAEKYLKNRDWIRGHNRIGRYGFYTSKKPSQWLFRERARRIVDTNKCFIDNKHCSGRIEVAHIDQDFTNNDILNIRPLCATHHRILDSHYTNGMRLQHLFDLNLQYVISSGKRRYKKSSFGGF